MANQTSVLMNDDEYLVSVNNLLQGSVEMIFVMRWDSPRLGSVLTNPRIPKRDLTIILMKSLSPHASGGNRMKPTMWRQISRMKWSKRRERK